MKKYSSKGDDGLNKRSFDREKKKEKKNKEEEGSDAFTTPLAQYKPHDDHLGLRRRRRTDVSYSAEPNLIQSEPTVARDRRLRIPIHFRMIMIILDPLGSSCKIFDKEAALKGKIADYISPTLNTDDLVLISKILNYVSFGGPTDDHHSGYKFLDADDHTLDVIVEKATLKGRNKLLFGRIVTIKKKMDDDYLSNHLIDLPTPLTNPSPKFDFISKFLNYVSLGGPMIDQIYHSILKKPVALLLNKPFDDHFGLRHRRIKLSSRGGTLDLTSWFRDDDYLLHRLIDLAKGVDVVSQMISPPTVIAAAGTDCNLNLATASVVTARPRHTEQRITPSSLLLNTPLLIDIPEGNSNDEELHGRSKGWSQKMDFEWIFIITNIVLESMSAIFTQLSSKQKPQYALFGMLLSYLALLTCIIELIYEGRRHQQIPIWRRRRGTWSYYRPQRHKSFATLNNIVALACALGQCVVTTINYRFESLIKLTVSPIILANGVLFSKILKYRQREAL